MKAARILLSILCVFALIDWIRADGGWDWPLPQVLPFMGGHKPSFYDVGGLIMLVILVSAMSRQAESKTNESSIDEPEYEEVDAAEEDELDEGEGDGKDDNYGGDDDDDEE